MDHASLPPLPVRLIAHRGYALHYPENTLTAFRAAAEAGADAVELDVQFSADGVPVVVHDADLKRTAGLQTRIDALSWEALRGTSVHEPDRFGERFRGEPLISLATAAEMLSAYPDLQVFIEVKGETVHLDHLPELMQRVIADSSALGRQRVIISFMHEACALAREAGVPGGWVLPVWSADALGQAFRLAPDYLFCNRDLLPADDSALPDGGWHWAIYEVVSAQESRRLARRGVSHVETMRVGELRRALMRTGATAGQDSRGKPWPSDRQ
ncbi:MAG: glycerophosphodiester phosphodiesterase [Ectothiorhodospiraceae bacterium]|nr:glycerophosphodiester phosphodiesterase [Ectothiorhodospiraceae bacterium]